MDRSLLPQWTGLSIKNTLDFNNGNTSAWVAICWVRDTPTLEHSNDTDAVKRFFFFFLTNCRDHFPTFGTPERVSSATGFGSSVRWLQWGACFWRRTYPAMHGTLQPLCCRIYGTTQAFAQLDIQYVLELCFLSLVRRNFHSHHVRKAFHLHDPANLTVQNGSPVD